MPRRFALALLLVLVLVLLALVGTRAVRVRATRAGVAAAPTAVPTPVVPPTPIPGRRVALYFESAADAMLHPEARDVPASSDAVAFLRSVASAVIEGPWRPDLFRPFPKGWRLRAAFLLANGHAVVDLAPPAEGARADGMPAPFGPRWNAGSHEEEMAIQSLAVSLARNVPGVSSVVLLVGGEPAETLGGHVDLTHPIRPDLARAADEDPGPPPETPVPTETPTPAATATASPAPTAAARRAPRPAASPTPRARPTRPAAEAA